ncbi:MAG: hypothetical protein QOD72_1548 [Acidimicrobiaceae bacterium]|nr:hypothetical protein [Acidimicrobiaceae bacterium]
MQMRLSPGGILSNGTKDHVRDALAAVIRARVVGPGGRERALELFETPGPRWFTRDRPIWRVHADPSMFVGGLRALLFQSLHPLAMAGVALHSDYRSDPWGRLQRTASFLTATTYGPADQAEAACRRVRAVHQRVRGVAPDGRPYSANDPELLRWVHLAEVDSFLTTYQYYGGNELDAADRDAYVADMAVVADHLGVPGVPTTVDELRVQLAEYQSELYATPDALEAARFLLAPPLPLVARAPYALVGAAAVATLPWWARLSLGLPLGPLTSRFVARPAGDALIGLLRWALTPTSPYADRPTPA